VKDLIAGSGISVEDREERGLKEILDRWHLLRVIDRRAVPLLRAETSPPIPDPGAASRIVAHTGNAGYRGRGP
jgi:hypothetical protein